MVLSFHPCYEADQNLICAGRLPNQTDLTAICAARAVVLPQGCSPQLYEMARRNCAHVFPHWDAKFEYPGKTGQIRLFRKFKVPHPVTFIFESTETYLSAYPPDVPPPLSYPYVLKLDWGGEGEGVFFIDSETTMPAVLEKVAAFEGSGQKGFLIQKYIPTNQRSLRVTVIGEKMMTYWRVQKEKDAFFTHVSKGAEIDYQSDRSLQNRGMEAVRKLCIKTGINLAGFDIIFDEENKKASPLFLEINYFFGRRGLGGSEKFYSILTEEINQWLNRLDIDKATRQ